MQDLEELFDESYKRKKHTRNLIWIWIPSLLFLFLHSLESMTFPILLLLFLFTCSISGTALYYVYVMKMKGNYTLSSEEEAIIDGNLWQYRHLDKKNRERFATNYGSILSNLRFIGQEGFEITEEIKIILTAYCALFALYRPHKNFNAIRIVLYPKSTIYRNVTMYTKDNLFSQELHLAWNSALEGIKNPEIGNTILLGLAKIECDSPYGVPGVGSGKYKDLYELESWQKLHYDLSIVIHRKSGPKTLSPSHFSSMGTMFEWGTERFFEKPQELHDQFFPLYSKLRKWYIIDPVRELQHPPTSPPTQTQNPVPAHEQ